MGRVTDSRQAAIIDASVLINFLAVNRADLLIKHPVYRFATTRHAEQEITVHYGAQRTRLDACIVSGALEVLTLNAVHELEAFGALSRHGLGAGECASIAAAATRGLPLAIDDRAARKVAARLHPSVLLLDTQGLVVDCLRASLLDIKEADAIKEEWATKHRFRLGITSFAELL